MEGVLLSILYTRPWSWRRGGWALPFVATGAAARSVWEVSVGHPFSKAPQQRKNGMRFPICTTVAAARFQRAATKRARERADAGARHSSAALGGENETRLGWVGAPGGICAPVASSPAPLEGIKGARPGRDCSPWWRAAHSGNGRVSRGVGDGQTGHGGDYTCLARPGLSPARLPDQEIPSSCDHRTTRPFSSSSFSPSLTVLMPVAITSSA